MLYSFLRLALKRIKSRPGVTILLILTVTLTLGVVASIPLFSGAVSRRIMQEELAARTKRQQQPAMSLRFYAMGTTGQPIGFAEAARYRDWIGNTLVRELGLPLKLTYVEMESRSFILRPKPGDTRYSEKEIDNVHIVHVENIAEHIESTAGQPYADDATSDDALLVWLEQRLADKLAVQVGDRFDLADSPVRGANLTPIEIAGFWRARDPEEIFWYREPSWHFSTAMITSQSAYIQHLYPQSPTGSSFAFWYYVFDDRRMTLTQAEKYVEALERIERDVAQRLPRGTMDNSPAEDLIRGNQRKQSLTIVLLGLSAPVLVIMVYFVGILSAMLVRFQSQEIAMFVSRGSSRSQMLLLNLMEAIIVLLIAWPPGILLGMGLARFLGYSQGFLSFAPRDPLPVRLISLEWRFLVIMSGIVVLARLVPTWRQAHQTIVVQEQHSARSRLVLGSVRLLLTGFLVAATIYAYRQLDRVGTMSLISWEPGDPSHDPLLLLAPSLFLLAAPLILCELFAWLARPLAWIGSLLTSPSAYNGCTELGREGGNYRTPIYMLVLCLSTGVFYASLARSADAWLIERRRYEVGSDLTFFPYFDTDAGQFGMSSQDIREAFGTTSQLPVEEYEQAPGALEAMPVGDFQGFLTAGKRTPEVRLMAIDRQKFPRVAYYRRDYAQDPLGELMNRLGKQLDGALLPEELAKELELFEGDAIHVKVSFPEDVEFSFNFTVVGTFRYFPTMVNESSPIVVVNLSYLQFETSSLVDHDIWMRLEPGVTAQEVLEDVEARKRVSSMRVHDLRQLIAEDQSRLERVGIFGMLSICFATGALLSALGLFVHSAASMRGRSLRFAVLQALGLTREQLMLGLSFEYSVALLYSVVAGLALGIESSRLYVPFFQLTDKREIPIPPYLPLIDEQRALWMAALMTLALALVVVSVFGHLLRTRVFEILRLGTRQ